MAHRYAVDIRESFPGDCIPPDGTEPKVSSIEEAKMRVRNYIRNAGSENVSAWLYYADLWDGISYGDPAGVLEIGPRGGIKFERY